MGRRTDATFETQEMVNLLPGDERVLNDKAYAAYDKDSTPEVKLERAQLQEKRAEFAFEQALKTIGPNNRVVAIQFGNNDSFENVTKSHNELDRKKIALIKITCR